MNATDRTADVTTSIYRPHSDATRQVDLAQYARDLAEQRDRYIADAKRSVSEGGVEFNVGYAVAMRAALALLHIESGGAFGAPRDEQPDPFQVPIASSGAESRVGGDPA